MSETCKLTILQQSNNNLDVFNKLDPKEARVLAVNRGVSEYKVTLFEKGEHDFTILYERFKYGVSINWKKYRRVTVERRVSVKNKKFYIMDNSGNKGPFIRPATVQMFLAKTYGNDINEREILYKRYAFLEFLYEYDLHISLNTVFKKELFTMKKAVAYYFGCQYSEEHRLLLQGQRLSERPVKVQKQIFKWLYNMHKLNPEIFRNMDYICDCTKMAEALNRKLDASWSYRRLTEEHDLMSREINNIVLGADDRPLNIYSTYRRFSDFVKIPLIWTTRELSLEGIMQDHCVGGYAERIDNGSCAIMHYKGFTLQIGIKDINYNDEYYGSLASPNIQLAEVKVAEGVYRKQFLGYKNRHPTEELRQEIDSLILNFNQHEKNRQEKATDAERNQWREARPATIMANNERYGVDRPYQARGGGLAGVHIDDMPF